MKRTAIALLVTFLAATAHAQGDWNQDNIGLYLNPAYPSSHCDGACGIGVHTVFVVGTNLTSPTVKAVEFKLTMTGPVAVGPMSFPAGIDLGTRTGEHVIAYTEPQLVNPGNGRFVFAEFDIFISDDTEPILGFISNIYFHSLDEPVPAYLDGEDLEWIKPLRNSTGDVTMPDMNTPVMVLNGDCDIVPNEDAAWGDVKALFR